LIAYDAINPTFDGGWIAKQAKRSGPESKGGGSRLRGPWIEDS
jgi:hypothetical protein